jgi:hypothetical protein
MRIKDQTKSICDFRLVERKLVQLLHSIRLTFDPHCRRAPLISSSKVPKIDAARLVLVESGTEAVEGAIGRCGIATHAPIERDSAVARRSAQSVVHVVLLALIDEEVVLESAQDCLSTEGWKGRVRVDGCAVCAKRDETVGARVYRGRASVVDADWER